MLNSVHIQGNLTDKPVLKTGSSGKKYTKFTVACNNDYGEEQKTDFIRCTAFESTAAFITNYFVKGSQILVGGQLHNNNFKDANGITHYTYDVAVSSVNFCGSKNNSIPQPAVQATAAASAENTSAENTADPPFTIVEDSSTPPSEGRITF